MKATKTVPRAARGRRSGPVRRIRDVLRTRILEGVYGALPLPSETDLALEFNASRNVVREVLALLRDEGLVTRIQGSGTFVVSAKADHGLDRLRGLAETFDSRYPRVTNRILLAELVPAVPLVAERLRIEPGAPVMALERLRMLDGEAVSLDASYLPADVGEPLLMHDLEHRDVFSLIESELGLPLGEARVVIESVAADPTVAGVLEARVGSPLLYVERLAHTDDGRPVDLEFLRFRGDRISLSTLLVRHPVHNPFLPEPVELPEESE
ncbi:GntR family transcriptional regulator [Glycomyces sp. L485]|uniref:GntR family transcriptional regulator n=1 Tax=Glycomyces sp. L485 TaxID=2909235 RepID=UPI001F4B686B|nr:GntR family transcriptional regulator [Glycomyces sp. L485]MCH7230559.1 GntR family transcriptional regulator [Glycomyces sp. L485]